MVFRFENRDMTQCELDERDFLTWIVRDILKEEKDEIAALDFSKRELKKYIRTIATAWYATQF